MDSRNNWLESPNPGVEWLEESALPCRCNFERKLLAIDVGLPAISGYNRALLNSNRESEMRFKLLIPALMLAAGSQFAASAAALAAAEGNAEAGAVKAYTCTGCHGIPGYHNIYPTYKVPKLAGQNYEYIVAALHAYRDGQRKHATMQSQAKALSEQDILDIAAYFVETAKKQ